MSQPITTAETTQRVYKSDFNKNKPRFIDINEVSYRTGYGHSTIWAKVRTDDFVQPIKIKAGVTRWLESDIDQWINGLVEAAK